MIKEKIRKINSSIQPTSYSWLGRIFAVCIIAVAKRISWRFSRSIN